MKKKEVAQKMKMTKHGTWEPENGDFSKWTSMFPMRKPGDWRKGKSKKGKGSLNPAQHDKNDFEGQKSYKQEDT